MQDHRNREKNIRLLIFLGYLFIIVARDPNLFITPRFWAEEGAYHFANSYHLPWAQALIKTEQGYLNFWPNFATVIASRAVPLEQAPLVTTLMAFLVQAVLGAWIVTTPAAIGARIYQKIAMLLIVLFVPLSGEMWLNTVNSMEFFCVLTFLILIEPAAKFSFRGAVGYGLLLLAGLTGLYSLLLTPFFLIKAWMEKSRERLAQGLVLTACGLIQALLILTAVGKGALAYRFSGLSKFSLRTMVVVFFSQSMGLLVAGLNQVKFILNQLGWLQPGHPDPSRAAALVILILEITFLSYLALKIPGKDRVIYLGSYLWLIIAAVYLSIDKDKSIYIQPGYGQRHFFAPNITLGLLILASIDWSCMARWRFRTIFATMVLGLAILFGITQFESTLFRYPNLPAWPSQVALWRVKPAYKMLIWPPPWTVNLLHPPQ